MAGEAIITLPSEAPAPSEAAPAVEAPTAIADSLIHEGDSQEMQDAIKGAIAEEAAAKGLPSEEPAKEEPKAPDLEEEAPKPAEKPADIEDKFWDAEKHEVKWQELNKSYQELQKKLSAPKAAEGENKEGDAPPVAKAAEVLKSPAFTEEFTSTGNLSEESRAKIADLIAPEFGEDARQLVDAYVEGQIAINAQKVAAYRAEAFTAAGGEAEYKAMGEWAKGNLEAAELEEYDDVLKSGNVKLMRLAVKAMMVRFRDGSGKAPTLKTGATVAAANTGVGSVYTSQEEINKDMMDPRYTSDPAYRKAVDAKIDRSTNVT